MHKITSHKFGNPLTVDSVKWPERCGIGGQPFLRCFLPKGGVFNVSAMGDDGEPTKVDGIPCRGERTGWSKDYLEAEQDAREREARGERVSAPESDDDDSTDCEAVYQGVLQAVRELKAKHEGAEVTALGYLNGVLYAGVVTEDVVAFYEAATALPIPDGSAATWAPVASPDQLPPEILEEAEAEGLIESEGEGDFDLDDVDGHSDGSREDAEDEDDDEGELDGVSV